MRSANNTAAIGNDNQNKVVSRTLMASPLGNRRLVVRDPLDIWAVWLRSANVFCGGSVGRCVRVASGLAPRPRSRNPTGVLVTAATDAVLVSDAVLKMNPQVAIQAAQNEG